MGDNTTVIDIVAQVTDETQAGASSATSTVSKLEQAMKKAQTGINKLKKMSKIELAMYAIDKASKVMNGVWHTGKKLAGKVWNVTIKAVDLATAPLRGIMRMITSPIVAAAGIAGIGLGAGDLVSTYKDFEQGMVNVKAIIRGTDEEMASLTSTAKKLGAETTFSAQQVAEAMEYLAMAGWKTRDITAGMPGLLDLAAAGGVDVATAADVVSGSLAQFNMEAKEASRVADVLAAAATNSKTDVQGLGESLKYAGTLAGALGYSIEDTALALGLLGNVNMQGSQAGTTIRGILSRMGGIDEDMLDDDKNKVAQVMKTLGLSMTDAEGKSKSLMHVMRELRTAFKNAEEAGENTTYMAKTLAGQYGMSGLMGIINADEKAFNSLADAIANSTGAAREMANIRMDTLSGAFEELSGAAETIKIEFMERLSPYIKRFVEWITGKMPGLQNAAVSFAGSVANTIDRMTGAIDSMVNSPEWQNAETLWDKVKVAWDKLIAQPFGEWWNGKGKAWLGSISQNIGRGIGSAIKYGISAMFGGNVGEVIDDGVSIGKSFAKGFSDGVAGIDWSQVVNGTANALLEALKLAFSNPVTGALATAWIGGKVLGGIGGVYNTVKGAKGLYTALFGGGAQAAGGAAAGGLLSGFGTNAILNLGIAGEAMGSGASSIGGLAAAGAAGIAGGVVGGVTLISAGADFYKALKSDDKKESSAYKESAAWKAGGVAAGAAIGTIIAPGLGTLIGAGIGGITGRIIGDNGIKKYEREMQAAEEAARKLTIQQEQAKYSSKKLKNAVQDLADGYISAEDFMAMKQSVITENIEKRFGTVKLSLSEIMRLAEKITFGDMKAGLDAFSEAATRADNSLANLRSTANELDRLNWKARIGIDYDKDEYQQGIDAFIANTKEYVESRQYEITLGSKLLLPDLDLSSLNATFSAIQNEIDVINNQLKIAIEVENPDWNQITELQKQVMDISNELTNAEYDAHIDLLKVNTGGKITAALNAGNMALAYTTFNQIQSELERYGQMASEAYTKAFTDKVTGLRLQLNRGFITQDEFDKSFAEFEESYQNNMNNFAQRQTNFLAEEIGEKFGLSAEDLTAGMQRSIQNGFNPATWTAQQAHDFLGMDSLGDGADAQLAAMINRLAASIPTLWNKAENEIWQQKWRMEVNQGTTRDANDQGGGIADIGSSILKSNVERITGAGGVIPHAEGGIMNRPHIGIVAEDGAEAIIPLTAKRRGRGLSLWEKAGELLGILPKEKSAGLTVQQACCVPAHASGGIFGAYADGGILDRNGLKSISDFTDSRGIMNSAHIGLAGEDGAEAIIPLSGKRRERGLALWKKAGEILGIRSRDNGEGVAAYAEGGILGVEHPSISRWHPAGQYGSGTSPIIPCTTGGRAAAGGALPVEVNMGGISVEVHVNGNEANDNNIIQTVREAVFGMLDDIANKMAVALEQVYANMTAV